MYLVLGTPHDPCCVRVRDALGAAGLITRIVEHPLAHPAKFSWRLDVASAVNEWAWDEQWGGDAREGIDGVLVRTGTWLEPAGWTSTGGTYLQAETHAALLAWLWSLSCPVINRYPATLWYQPPLSVLAWRPLLRHCGLDVPATLVSNVEDEAKAFGRRRKSGVQGVVYAPLTSHDRYLVATDDEWKSVAAVLRRTPVCLTLPHTVPQRACVVGTQIVWDGAPPADADVLALALGRLAATIGLTFLEVVLGTTADGRCVVALDHYPRLERFGARAQREIVDALVGALTATTMAATACVVARRRRR